MHPGQAVLHYVCVENVYIEWFILSEVSLDMCVSKVIFCDGIELILLYYILYTTSNIFLDVNTCYFLTLDSDSMRGSILNPLFYSCNRFEQ